MVKKTTKERKEYFQCEECLLLYKNKEMAEKCERWCKKHKSCNIDIISHAVK